MRILLALITATAFSLTEGQSLQAETAITTSWNQWGGSPQRNNVPVGTGLPTNWDVGEFDFRTGEWDDATARNIKWVSRLGSQTYGSVVVTGGKAYVGTNNGSGHIERYPSSVDLGCLLCFDTKDGSLLWQHSSEKLKTGRVHDWPLQGICCSPLVEGDRLWFVTSRGEVRCLDTEGFQDNENDGPVQDEEYPGEKEADVVWVLDMMRELGVSQHNMCACSVTAVGDVLYVVTANGVDESHKNLPAPNAPSFIAVDKNTGKVLWKNDSPGDNIFHGQWSNPTYGEFNGQPQIIFAGGDGWVRSFDPEAIKRGETNLLWEFDANPKETVWNLGRGTRNNVVATPVVYDGLVYVQVGQDPEHGEGDGHFWCIDPNKRGDVSPELAFNSADPSKPIAHKRIQAVVPEEGDFSRPNENSAVVWHYGKRDENGDGEIEFEEEMHRGIGSPTIKDNIIYIADLSGLVHCLDAKTGKRHWYYDMMAQVWGSPCVVDGKVYIGDDDGDISVFKHSADPKQALGEEDGEPIPRYGEVNTGNSVRSTPVVVDNVLYLSNLSHLFAVIDKGEAEEE